MKYTVERIFSNIKHECLGWSYQNFDDMLKELLYGMRDKIGHPFIGEQYHTLRFVMNVPLYHEFFISCQMAGKNSEWCRGIKIIEDPTLYVNDSQSPYGIVRLVYEESGTKRYSRYFDFWTGRTGQYIEEQNPYYRQCCVNDVKTTHELYYPFRRVPHIDHVKFNGPATIVFWKDGTKTVVKHDGKGRKDKRLAILYAFIRKIYGEGKPYHNILNEIEEAIK